jgi:hypothetical protein
MDPTRRAVGRKYRRWVAVLYFECERLLIAAGAKGTLAMTSSSAEWPTGKKIQTAPTRHFVHTKSFGHVARRH